jgi:ubiquinone biosynthesis protein
VPPSPANSLLGVAARDLGRLRFVAATVARHGFGEIVMRSPMGRRLLNGRQPQHDDTLEQDPPPVRFRKLLEALGPTYIKLGQILSSRVDLLPPDYIIALQVLQDGAPVLPYEQIKEAVETGLGAPIEQSFASFDVEPLATASIAQTHLATTHEGERVVVKVQRPGVSDLMRGDLDLLYLAARALEATIDELDIYGPSEIVQAFEHELLKELNFHHELRNLVTAGSLLKPGVPMTTPGPYPELSSRTVLTMQFFKGRTVRSLTKGSPEAKAAIETILHTACHQGFLHGFFHGDPHPGNILIDDEQQLCMIDMGMTGQLSMDERDDIVALVLAAIVNDVDTIARLFLKMGRPTQRIPMKEFKAEISRIRRTSLVANNLEDVDSGRFVQDFVGAAQRFRIKLNANYSLLVKAVITLEGVIRALDPNADIVGIAKPYAEAIVKERYTPEHLMEEVISGVTGIGGLARSLPGHLDQVLHDLETGNLQVRAVNEPLEPLVPMLHQVGSRLTLAMFSGSSTVAAALLLPNDPTSLWGLPLLGTLLTVAAVLGWLVLWWWHFVGQGRKIRVSPLLKVLQRALPLDDDSR